MNCTTTIDLSLQIYKVCAYCSYQIYSRQIVRNREYVFMYGLLGIASLEHGDYFQCTVLIQKLVSVVHTILRLADSWQKKKSHIPSDTLQNLMNLFSKWACELWLLSVMAVLLQSEADPRFLLQKGGVRRDNQVQRSSAYMVQHKVVFPVFLV